VAFENYVKEIRRDEEEGKYVSWEKAYRDVMEKLGNAERDSEGCGPTSEVKIEWSGEYCSTS
jgi:hypothetical protein